MTPAARSPLLARLGVAYFGLSFPFHPFEQLLWIGPLVTPWSDAFTGAVAWISEHVFHRGIPFLHWTSSKIDGTQGYERAACLFVAAAVIAGVWFAVDRRREDRAAIGEWLHVWLRYAVASAMLYYGVAKVTLGQFPYPAPERLMQPFGESSPMALLWTFMGYSPGYCIFTGSVECLAGLLLLFRRTATLGALVVIGAMANVLALNLSYDVPIKLYSFHLLVMGGLVLAPDARRLADALFHRRAIDRAPIAPHFASSRVRRALAWGKGAFVALLLYSHGARGIHSLRELHAPRPPLYGIYEVESFVRDGVEIPPLLTDTTRWRRVAVSGEVATPKVSIWSMNDERASFKATDDAEHRTLSIKSAQGKSTSWAYALTGRDLVLRGSPDGAVVEVKLRRLDESSLLLVSRGFRWVAEPVPNW